MKTVYAILVAAVLVGCASIQPARVQVGDTCYRCHRSIGDPKLAGEIIDQLNAPFPFRTTGCLAKYLKANPDLKLRAVFVTDFRTGHMLLAEDAWFVPATLTQAGGKDGKKTESDYFAFRSRADAMAVKDAQAAPLRWSQVLADAQP
ncbi:MAG TPA: hypothetical protein VL225_12785 [Vicinamibacterales bacterium]|jgi:hypothetical protein|nr:hypothetical protein [Vicinamibacterales bacterium]